jgi:hypothetical protein
VRAMSADFQDDAIVSIARRIRAILEEKSLPKLDHELIPKLLDEADIPSDYVLAHALGSPPSSYYWSKAVRKMIDLVKDEPKLLSAVEAVISRAFEATKPIHMAHPGVVPYDHLEKAIERDPSIKPKYVNMNHRYLYIRIKMNENHWSVFEIARYAKSSMQGFCKPCKRNIKLLDLDQYEDPAALLFRMGGLSVLVRCKGHSGGSFIHWMRSKDMCVLALSNEHEYETIYWGDDDNFSLVASMRTRREEFSENLTSYFVEDDGSISSTLKKTIEKHRNIYYNDFARFPIFESSAKVKHVFKDHRQTFGILWLFWAHHPANSQERENVKDILKHLGVWTRFISGMIRDIERLVNEENFSDWIVLQKEFDWPHTNSLVRFIEISNVIYFASNVYTNGSNVSPSDVTHKVLYDKILHFFPKTRYKMAFLDGYNVEKSINSQREHLLALIARLDDDSLSNDERFEILRLFYNSFNNRKRKGVCNGPSVRHILNKKRMQNFDFDSQNCSVSEYSISNNQFMGENDSVSSPMFSTVETAHRPFNFHPMPMMNHPQLPYDSMAYTPTNQVFHEPPVHRGQFL